MKITIAVMKKHLVLLNKSLRKDMLVSGLSKMKGEDVKKNFNERFLFDESRKHYMPNEKFFDELEPEISAGSFEDLMPKEKPKKQRSEKQKANDKKLGEMAKKKTGKKPIKFKVVSKSTHTMPDGTVMTGAKHNKNSKPVKAPKKAPKKAVAPKKVKKERSEKQKANDKKLGEMAKKKKKGSGIKVDLKKAKKAGVKVNVKKLKAAGGSIVRQNNPTDQY